MFPFHTNRVGEAGWRKFQTVRPMIILFLFLFSLCFVFLPLSLSLPFVLFHSLVFSFSFGSLSPHFFLFLCLVFCFTFFVIFLISFLSFQILSLFVFFLFLLQPLSLFWLLLACNRVPNPPLCEWTLFLSLKQHECHRAPPNQAPRTAAAHEGPAEWSRPRTRSDATTHAAAGNRVRVGSHGAATGQPFFPRQSHAAHLAISISSPAWRVQGWLYLSHFRCSSSKAALCG